MREGRTTYRILDLDESERPRERLSRLGAGVLTDAELLAILLRVGVQGENAVQVGQRLLHNLGGLAGIQSASIDEVIAEEGIGPAKAAQIKAAIELGRRLAERSPEDRPAIHSPQDAANRVLFQMGALEQEEMWVMLLDTRNRIVKTIQKYKGSVNSSQVRVGELFREAIQANAHSVILIHNHPSGDPTPSPEDILITQTAVSAGKLLDIEVLDHLVIGRNRWVSLKERGLGFGSR